MIKSLEEENLKLQNTIETLKTANNDSKLDAQNQIDLQKVLLNQCEQLSSFLQDTVFELNREIVALNDRLQDAVSLPDIPPTTEIELIVSEQSTRSKSAYYYASKTPLSWFNAQSACNDLGAHLVEINDEAEHDFVVQFVKDNMDESVWVGGRYVTSEGVWRWDSSMDLIGGDAYTNWAPGQPADSSSASCLQLWKERGYKWDDFFCNLSRHFVCDLNVV